MPLEQAESLIGETSETFSSGASPTRFEMRCVRVQERTEGSSGAPAVDDGITFQGRTSVISRDEQHPTSTEGRSLNLNEQCFRIWQQSIYQVLLETFKEKLRKMAERKDNWNGKNSKKPSPLILSRAHLDLDSFLFFIVDNGRLWKKPFVSSDEDGHVTIQWNSGDHELHIEIGEEGTEYTKVWGVNIENEMHVGPFKETEFLKLWDWLNNDSSSRIGQRETLQKCSQ